MSRMQRSKGQAGEREAAAVLAQITGHEVKRRVRQHEGDSDLDFPGWAVEIKRHARATPATIGEWWAQAVRQAERAGLPPLLLWRANRGPWRACWAPTGDSTLMVEASIGAWWRLQGHGWPAVPAQPDHAPGVDLVRPVAIEASAGHRWSNDTTAGLQLSPTWAPPGQDPRADAGLGSFQGVPSAGNSGRVGCAESDPAA